MESCFEFVPLWQFENLKGLVWLTSQCEEARPQISTCIYPNYKMYLSTYQNVFVHIPNVFVEIPTNDTGKVECEGGSHKLAPGLCPSFNIMRPAGKLPRHTFNFNDCQALRRKTHKINCHIFGGNESNFSHKKHRFSARWVGYLLVTAFSGASGIRVRSRALDRVLETKNMNFHLETPNLKISVACWDESWEWYKRNYKGALYDSTFPSFPSATP